MDLTPILDHVASMSEYEQAAALAATAASWFYTVWKVSVGLSRGAAAIAHGIGQWRTNRRTARATAERQQLASVFRELMDEATTPGPKAASHAQLCKGGCGALLVAGLDECTPCRNKRLTYAPGINTVCGCGNNKATEHLLCAGCQRKDERKVGA